MRLEGAPFTSPGGEALMSAYETGKADATIDRKRRTRILALDAAARVAAGVAANPQHDPNEGGDREISRFIIGIAEYLERYIDGGDDD